MGRHVYLADFDSDRQIRHVGSHLACFYGGNWLYGEYEAGTQECPSKNWFSTGGRLLNNQTIVNIGLQLVDACWNTYASTAYDILILSHLTHVLSDPFGNSTGIGPETFAFISSDGNFTGGSIPSQSQLTFNNQHGFYVTNGVYILRPEVLESNFYAFRVTGDTKYLDRAAAAVKSFNEFLATPNGFAALNDVTNPSLGLIDDTESFWFAEVLKYLWVY